MFGIGRLKFRSADKKSRSVLNDEDHISDYQNAEEIGRVRLGKLCLYYRDLGVKYYCPYEYIDRSFNRISECHPDDSPAYYYYRLILVHDGKEFANLIFNKEQDVDTIIEKLKLRNPQMDIGYLKTGEKRKYFC